MNNFKAIIFDLGKVVFDLSVERIFHHWAMTSRCGFNDIKNKFQFDQFVDDFEKNEISERMFRSEILRRLELNLSDKDFDASWCNLYLETYTGIDNILIELKQRYRIVALTNTNSIHTRVWNVKYADTLQHFEKVFCSHEIKTRKPERKAFQTVVNYLQVKPVEIIFLDDNTDNTTGASELGIVPILVTSMQQMTGELRNYKLLI